MLRRVLCLLLALSLLGLAPLRGWAMPMEAAPAPAGMPCHEHASASGDAAVEAPSPSLPEVPCCPLCGDGQCALCASCAVVALQPQGAALALGEAAHEPWGRAAAAPLPDPVRRVPLPPPRSWA